MIDRLCVPVFFAACVTHLADGVNPADCVISGTIVLFIWQILIFLGHLSLNNYCPIIVTGC